MSVFIDEDKMQQWLEKKFTEIEGLNELITNREDIENYVPQTASEEKIKNSYIHSLDSLSLNEVISANENISLTTGEVLKPDIIAYAAEKESIVIIELKNFANATRQAGTELVAYSGEIKSSLSYLSDGDIVNVIISPTWPTLLKHFIFNNIVWQGKYILCLEPVLEGKEITLKAIEIDKLDIEVSPDKFCEEHLAGYHICLYDDTQQTENPEKTELHKYTNLMKQSMECIATKGEKLNGHGFAFLSKEIHGFGLSPYFISIVNVAPFNSLERMIHMEDFQGLENLPNIIKKYIDIYIEHSPTGHGDCLNTLAEAGNELLENICTPRIEGFTTWSEIKHEIESRWKPIYFSSWGLFKELAIRELSQQYKNGIYNEQLSSPSLGYKIIDKAIDSNYSYIELSYLMNPFDDDE